MRELTTAVKEEIENIVYDFFAENCEFEREKITSETNVIDDLDGDSLMLLELLESLSQKYGLNIEMQVIGLYLLQHPATTIGDIIELSYAIYQKENNLVEE
jgi:acyl carrier protein